MAKSKFDRTCSVCGTHYEYCGVCSQYQHLPRWMDAYCSENCKDLYNITAGWINGWLDKEVELARLNKSDLSKKDQFPKWMRDTIKQMKAYVPEVSMDAVEKVLSETEETKEDNETSTVKEDEVVENKEVEETKPTDTIEKKFVSSNGSSKKNRNKGTK